MERYFQIVFLLLGSLKGVWSLRILSIDVPRIVLAGENQSTILHCSYDLEGATLYSIRWLRDESEFYRYTPKEIPSMKIFPLPGARVDHTLSDAQRVSIMNLNCHLSGVYHCEVTIDNPDFYTDIRSAPLTVVDVAMSKPDLSVSRHIYARNDVLQANCSTAEAYPAPNVTWTLNGHKIAEVVSRNIANISIEKRGVLSQLDITIQEKDGNDSQQRNNDSMPSTSHYSENDNIKILRYIMEPPASGQFTINCIATIFDIYAKSSEVMNIHEDNLGPDSVTKGNSLGVQAFGDYCVILIAIFLLIFILL